MTLKTCRRLVAAPVALAVAVGIAGGTAQPAKAADLPMHQAVLADAFVDSVGVATHLTYDGTPYMNYPLVQQRLGELGIRHIRDGWGTGSAYASDFVRNSLGPLGVKVTMVVDPGNNASAAAQKEMIKSQLLPVIDGAESLNEPDTNGGDWATSARTWTVQLSQAIKSDSATQSIPVLAPALADTNDTTKYQVLGDLSAYVDRGNTHDYPGNQYHMSDQIMNTVKKNSGIVAPGKPIIATETGFSTGTANAPYSPMPEARVATSLPRLFLDHFARGIARTYDYELFDQHADSDFESNFGLLRNNGTPKASFTALRNLIGLLSDKGKNFAPSSLDYNINGGDANTRTLLLQKQDGTFYLAVWQQAPEWNGSSVLAPPSRNLQVQLEMPVSASATYLPNRGVDAVARTSQTSSVSVPSSSEVAVVELAGAGEVVTPPTPSSGPPVAVSATAWQQVRNGWGPVEKDRSVGEDAAGDGRTITIGGRTFPVGLGVHASSEVVVPVVGASQFSSQVGVDDEVGSAGSVVFQVWAGTAKLADSGVIRGGDPARTLTADVSGRSEVRLVVTDAGDGIGYDHADWAIPILS